MWLGSRSIPTAILSVVRDHSGATATILAIALPCLLGVGALGVETGVWFTIKLQNQSAADAAGIAAAYGVIAGKTTAGALTVVADEAARRNGYKGSTPSVVYPYSDSVVSNGLTVTLEQSQGALLGAMFLSSTTVTNTAVAVIEVLDTPCILALGATSSGVELTASTWLDMPNCSVATNSISSSAIALRSSSSVTATTLFAAGEISLQGTPIDPSAPPPQFTLSSPAMIGTPSVLDPYAGTLTHAFLTAGMPKTPSCISTVAGLIRTFSGNCAVAGTLLSDPQLHLSANTQISGPWKITSGQIVDLSPGIYWVTGSLTLQSGAVLKCSTCDNNTGAGVTIILSTRTNKVGAASVASGAMLTLNASNSGPFAGLLIIQDSNGLPPGTTYASSSSKIGGTPSSTLNGLVYFPNSLLTFHGAPSSTGPRCLVVIGNAVKIDATSTLDTAGCPSAGITNLPTISKVSLAE